MSSSNSHSNSDSGSVSTPAANFTPPITTSSSSSTNCTPGTAVSSASQTGTTVSQGKTTSSEVSPASTPASQSSSNVPLSANAPKFGTLIPNRIFVGGIPANTTEDELKTFFSTFGPVKDTKIINDRAGISKGCVKPYGFVTFENQESAEKVIRNEADNLIFKERKLNIGHAIRKQQALARPEPPGAVFFTSGSVPYTYQNGMAIFHVPGQEFPFLPAAPQPPSYAAAAMMLPQPTVYLPPHPPPTALPSASFPTTAAAPPVLPAPTVVPNLTAAVSQNSASNWTAAAAASAVASQGNGGGLSSVGQPWNSAAAPAGLSRSWPTGGAANAHALDPNRGQQRSLQCSFDPAASLWNSNQYLTGLPTTLSPAVPPGTTPLLYQSPATQSGAALLALDPHQLLSAASSGTPTALDYQHAAAVAAAAANSVATAATGSHDDLTNSAGTGLDLPSAKRRRFEAPTGSPVTPAAVYYSHSAAAAYH